MKALPTLCRDLLARQQEAWADCRSGYAALQRIKERTIRCAGFSVRVQQNQGRSRSSLADVTAGAVKARPCFLCSENRPAEQEAIPYRDDYLILCNPMPVFPAHFTITHRHHRPQQVADVAEIMLSLASDLGQDWCVLYNGPRCGASAPDHLHLQAVPSGLMPIEHEIRERERLTPVRELGGVRVATVQQVGRQVVILRAVRGAGLSTSLLLFLAALKEVVRDAQEPMTNIVAFHEGETVTVMVFPRAAHRPRAFYLEGDARLLLSPAVVEMAGVLVTPAARDFERLDAPLVEAVYREVSLAPEVVEAALAAM